MQRIACAAPIAKGDVEVTVRTESELAPIVIIVRLIQRQQDALAGRVGAARISGRYQEFGNDRLQLCTLSSGVVHIKLAILAEAGMKRESEQPGFTAGGHIRADIQERSGQQRVALDSTNRAALFQNEPAATAIVRRHKASGVA